MNNAFSKMNKTTKMILRVFFVISIYLVLRTSYILEYDKPTYLNFLQLLLIRLIPIPFKLCFHIYSLIWIALWLLLYAYAMYEAVKPKAQLKWQDIEQGSNEFQNNAERKEFIAKCTDDIIKMYDDDINNILFNIKERSFNN